MGQFKQYMAAYWQMHQKEMGCKARVSGGDGKALKAIMAYLTEEAESEADALFLWETIMLNWSKLNDFLRTQTRLTQINKNLVEIIVKLKRYAEKESTSKAASAIDRIKNGSLS